jgi:hypothetical protein
VRLIIQLSRRLNAQTTIQLMLPSFRRPPPLGRDIVEEFVACKMLLLASSFSFRDMTINTTRVSNIWMSLPLFPIEPASTGDAAWVLAEVETKAERYLGSFRPREYDALLMANLQNKGRLNQVLDQMGWLMPRAHFPAATPLKQ